MITERIKPIVRITTAVIGGVIIVLSTVLATSPLFIQILTVAAATVVVSIGIMGGNTTQTQKRLRDELSQMAEQLTAIRAEDASLRTRMAYTLRDPLACDHRWIL